MMIYFLFACSSQYNLSDVEEKINAGESTEVAAEEEELIEEEVVEEDLVEEEVEEPIEEEAEEEEEIEEEEIEEEEIEEEEKPEIEEPDYCTPFDDFSEWSYFGDGNWHIDNNLLYENRGGYYATTAYLYDFGQASGFSMEVSAFWEGNLNDLSGFVFNLDTANGTHWTATIDDPQGDYSRYSPTGGILISQCVWDECTVVAQDSTLNMYAQTGVIVTLRLEVVGEYISFYWNDTLAFSQIVPGVEGPGTVGLYSNDNDGGVIYDDFCIDAF